MTTTEKSYDYFFFSLLCQLKLQSSHGLTYMWDCLGSRTIFSAFCNLPEDYYYSFSESVKLEIKDNPKNIID